MNHFHVGRSDDAVYLVERFHYSHRAPANIQYVGTWHEDGGLFGDFGDAIAACLFGIPAAAWREPVLELSRLVRKPDATVSLTGLISETVKFVKQDGVHDLLISYADRQQTHHGGIYQAASWSYGGLRRVRIDGVMIDDHFQPIRNSRHDYGTSSIAKIRERANGRNVQPHYDEGKHLYWRALNKAGRKKAERLSLGMLPYPKPLQQDHTS